MKGKTMFNTLANTFMTATRTDARSRWGAPSHWAAGERFDNRADAELEAHTTARRRD